MACSKSLTGLALFLLVWSTPGAAQDGAELVRANCEICHLNPVDDAIPPIDAIRRMDPNAIIDTLTVGTMRLQGQLLTPDQHVAVAEYLTGLAVVALDVGFEVGLCDGAPPFPSLSAGGIWNGWGPDTSNTRYQADGGLAAGDVPKLTLKWAFGIPGASQSRSQPAVVGGRVFMGSQSGRVYALDARTGCTYWVFEADAWVRTAISVGPYSGGYALYFADAEGRAYAVDAQTGRQIWTFQIDDHPAARATGSPTLYDGRVYFVVSGVSEETAASMPGYECCTFRGSMTAADAETGAIDWKTYTLPAPRRRGTSSSGAPLWGPAGAPIWSSPTIDPKRGLIYAASGNSYADPPAETSDAILAFSIETGAIVWVNQITPGDVWILGCDVASSGDPQAGDNPNCPSDVGPDHDFSASPALITMADGRDVLVISQKSGVGYALDPDANGRVLWEYRWGQGSPVGGVWGATTDGERAYFAVADQRTPSPGGLHAVDLFSGDRLWYSEPHAPMCGSGPGCSSAQSAALTSMPGIVFSGSADGGIRAYAAETGDVVWSFDTNTSFATVNGVEATGGSMDGPGPVIAGGMLFVTAGNGGFVGTPGNVLLAFEVVE